MIYSNIFTSFNPHLLTDSIAWPESLITSFGRTNLLVCGELHGAQENAHALYTIVSKLGPVSLAIERTEKQTGQFIQSALAGKPDFSLINPEIFAGSMLTIETAKTLSVLHANGLLSSIYYIDTDDEDIEQGLANNILKLPVEEPTISLMGNWHSIASEVETEHGKHRSALLRVRSHREVTYLEYRYGQGAYYNLYGGLITLKTDDSVKSIEILQKSKDDFELHIPYVTPIAYRVSSE